MATKRVLIADDHGVFRECLASMLQNAGLHIVAQCRSGAEAIEQAASQQPDLVLMDVSMPVIDGITAIREVHAQCPGCLIVMLTMHDSPDVCQRALAAGASGYVVKDDAFREVLVAIAKGTAAAPYVSSSIRKRLAEAGKNSNSGLTAREMEILRHITTGKSNRLIADELGISLKTVDVHRTNLMRKLDLHTVADLVKYAIQTGLV